MIEMAGADGSWPQRPENPDLCLVCDDIIAGVQRLLDQQSGPAEDTTPPVTIATAQPGPNEGGWNSDDVHLALAAVDEPEGSGVKEVEFSLTGAQGGGAVQAGASAETVISAEGTTTVAFLARDNEGNEESPAKTLAVNLDRTPPVIEVVASPAPNAFGWNNSDVTVSFAASDTLSGLAGLSPLAPVLVTGEGTGQEIIGTASDVAGNSASASVVVNLDKAPPVITPPSDVTIPATEAGGTTGNASTQLAVFLTGGSAVDTLDPSPQSLSPLVGGIEADSTTLFPPGTTPVTFRFSDAAGNIGNATANVTVVLGQPRLSGAVAGKGVQSPGVLFVDVRFSNTGTGNARNVRINQATLRTLSGSGTVTYNGALSPALPYAIGSLDLGASTTVRFYLNVPSTVTRFSITETGALQNVAGTGFSYSIGQPIIP
jgi:hypothetical protein